MRLKPWWLMAALLASTVSFAAETKEAFKLVHVNDVVSLQQNKTQKVYLEDANDSEFRAKNGIIPGATLLSSFNKYDVAKELPADKNATLVFYCANSH